ncbi:MAG: hypothetical protein LLG06_18060 [Desulfobacteraceae bacterium]|nr:hypothetical protein [Desulfobacteraceae bacterium]
MLVRHKKTMNFGLFLAVSFLGVLFLIFSPIFGEGKNGLEYSDALFNKLAKGSSNFIAQLRTEVKAVEKEELAVTVKMESADQAAKAVKIFTTAGAQASAEETNLRINANLAPLLSAVLDDSNAMYYNKGSEISAKYGMDEKDVMATWWSALNKSVKELQKAKKTDQASVIHEVMKKGIEPAYNFYTVEPQSISERALTALSLLVFYVLYTLWWGFAIFYLFDGLGLSMKKAKVKQEV